MTAPRKPRSNPSQIFRISLDHPIEKWNFPMPDTDEAGSHPKIPSEIIIETILAALIQRRNVLVYGRAGGEISSLLRGVEAQSLSFGKSFAMERLIGGKPIDLDETFLARAAVIDELALPGLSMNQEGNFTGFDGLLVGLTAAKTRAKALEHWQLFLDGTPDLIIEVAEVGLFYNVTEGGLSQDNEGAP